MRVAITGSYVTKFGELWEDSFYSLAEHAAKKALSESRVDPKKIDAIFVANMLAGNLIGQNHLGAQIATLLDLNCPAYTIEAACASGGVAVNLACEGITGGAWENVLVVGAEKMTDDTTAKVSTGLMGAASEEERQAGLTFPGLYALMASAHMQKYNTTRRQMASVAVKNHANGNLNPIAQYHHQIKIDEVISSQMIASPLTLLDCSPITDGAASLVLSAANNTKNDQVTISASAVATGPIDLAKRKSLDQIEAAQIAAQKAYEQAGLTPADIDIAEVHDCFTIAEIIAMEDLGFCKKGLGGKFVESGITKLGGKMPVNTSGGLKACGHPVGATGIKQIIEIANQLKGKAEKRQVKGAKIGLTHNVGGSGATAAVHILQI